MIHQHVAHAVDIHDTARGEMQDGFLQPRRAVGVDAAAGRFAFFPHHFAAADRAMFGHAERPALAALAHDAHHFRNHVAAAFHQHTIADLDSQPLDFVFVVQRGARDGDAADVDGLQVRHRRQRAGAAHLHFDIFDHGLGLLRGEFEGDGPARRFGGPAESSLLRDGIHLDHDAIDFVRQRLALRLPMPVEFQHVVQVGALGFVRIHLESHLFEALKRFPVGGGIKLAVHQQEVGEVIQAARGGDGGSRARSDPAAALRGLAKRESCCCSRSAFSLSKDFRGMITSPRTSNASSLDLTRSGRERMVRAFSVTSSPTTPSPRVMAWCDAAVAVVRGHGQAVQLQLGDIFIALAAQQRRARAGRTRAVRPHSGRCPGSAWASCAAP